MTSAQVAREADAVLSAVQRQSLSEAVFLQLRGAILDGGFAPGDALPAERSLCERFGVNRAALREALKRLEELRLITIRQGEATRVRDYRLSGGLELLVALLFGSGGGLRLDVARSFIELRTALGPDIARLAARRARPEQIDALRDCLGALRRIKAEGGDVVALQRASLEFWRQLVLASHNVAYQLAFNTMERGWSEVQDALAPALAAEVTDTESYESLTNAIARHRPELARRLAEALVKKGAAGIEKLLAALGG